MKHTSSSLRFATLALIFAAFSAVAFTACTAKRPETFAQGQGSGLEDKKVWEERLIPLHTGAKIGTSGTTHAQNGLKISPKVKAMNHFDFVKIDLQDKSLATLLGTPPFRGRENTTDTYSIKVKLTDNYLKFYTVAKPEDIAFEERSYSEETLEDGRIAVPLVGYKIEGYFRIEAVKTSDDLNSHHLTEIAELDTAKATHVRIDWDSRELFSAVKTSDLIPAELFFVQDKEKHTFKPFEWYYAETIMEKSMSDTETYIGEMSAHSENSQLVPASKIIFVPNENELRVVNVARDERLNRDKIQSEDLNTEAALIIPVKWTEYQTKDDGVNKSMTGELVEDNKWDQRSSFELNIADLKSASVSEGTTRLLDIEIDQNYFSFTVLNMIGNQGRKIHYSFLRADQGRAPYVAKRSFKTDQSKFGYFTSDKPFIPDWEYYTEEDFNKRINISRMNPDANEIVFHLSAGSPKCDESQPESSGCKLQKIAENAVSAWDKTFQESMKGTGKEIKVSFSRNPVQLGDLRYNVIHMVESLAQDGLLGFGPSVADPETGEIIAATTNVYVNSTQAIAAGSVRQYIIDRMEKRLTGKSTEATGQPVLSDVSNGSTTHGAIQRFHEAAKNMKSKKFDTAALGKLTKADIQKDLKELAKDSCKFAEQAVMDANDRDIQNYCPEIEAVIAANEKLDYVSRGKSDQSWETLWLAAKNPVLSCATKIAHAKLLSTLIHEIGHNFGLRHNFYGSYDKDNFKKVTTVFGEEITAHSSSIMEYTNWAEDRLPVTGNYDIAAIRYGYGGKVEMKDGSMADVDTTKPLDVKGLKPFMFCSDEIAYTGLSAFCKTDDAGTTPMEVVKSHIENYKRSMALRKFRRVRPIAPSPDDVADRNLGKTFLPLKDIYDEWRYQLGEFVRKSGRYLGDFDSDTYPQVLAAMKADSQYGPIYAQYHDAADLIYSFFKEVAFGPNEYCLIQDGADQRAIELERLRDLLSESTRGAVQIRTCADAAAAKELATILDANAPTILSQVGYPINSYGFEKPESLDEYLQTDVVGNDTTRTYAGLLINLRMPNIRNIINQFAPNMTDEPTHYVDFATTLMGRLINGVDLSAYGIEEAQPLFTQEAGLMSSLAAFFKSGLYTPEERLNGINRVVTGQKMAPLTVYHPSQTDDAKQFAAVLTLNDQVVFAAIKKNHIFAYNLINKFNSIDNLLNMEEVSPALQMQVFGLLAKSFPKAADLPTKTVEDFAKVLGTLQKIEEVLPAFAACIEENTPMLAQINEALPTVGKDYQAASEGGEEAEKAFMAQNLVDYMKKVLPGKDLLFAQENLKDLIPAMDACAEAQTAAVKKVNRNRKDYHSQKSMILEVLNEYAN